MDSFIAFTQIMVRSSWDLQRSRGKYLLRVLHQDRLESQKVYEGLIQVSKEVNEEPVTMQELLLPLKNKTRK